MRLLLAALALPAALLCATACGTAPAADGAEIVFVGTYTRGTASRGIQAWTLDPVTGDTTPLGLAGAASDPSFIDVLPDGRTLLAVDESGNAVSAFAIAPSTAKLTLRNRVDSRGAGPAWVSHDRTGKLALVANYGSGSVAVFPVGVDGRLGPSTGFAQDGGSAQGAHPHAHAMVAAPDNRFALVADLGADKLIAYRLDAATGALDAAASPVRETAAGAGPRHLVFGPGGRLVHVVDEITSTVTTYGYAPATGELTRLQSVSTLPAGTATPNTGAETALHPNGRFLYVSNRGHDSIAIFELDAATGLPRLRETVPTRGRTPRSFAFDPAGRWLLVANQASNEVAVFRVDPETGHPAATGRVLKVDAPACVAFMPVAKTG